ncbi:MAG: cytochrome c [Chloroflexi bacterium]|nr:cytochrome c [Chloroflexota bacterium]
MVPRRILGGIAGSLIMAVWLVPISFAAAPAAQSTAASATAGQSLYQQDCASCHGPDAKGGMKLGDTTSADLRWQVLGPVYHNDPALVQRAILQGLDEDGQPLDAIMPRWQSKLSPAQAQDIIAYLQSLSTAVPGKSVTAPAPAVKTPAQVPATGGGGGSSTGGAITLLAMLAIGTLGLAGSRIWSVAQRRR